MIDRDLTALRRASEAEPTDAGKRAALEQAWLRQGLGWHGEVLPGDPARDPWFVLPDSERGVYRFATQGNVIKLVYVPGGEVACQPDSFANHRGEQDWQVSDNKLTASAKIAPFYVGRFPVTCAEYAPFLMQTPSAEQDERQFGHSPGDATTKPHHPVVNVTHQDALAYCSWAGLRLPTAAEWRWAALGARCPSEAIHSDLEDAMHQAGAQGKPGRHDGCTECHGKKYRRYPWGNEPPTPERCAASDPRYQGKSTAPVVVRGPGETRCRDCGEVITRPVGGQHTNGPVRSHYTKGWSHVVYKPGTLTPARPLGASWCEAHDLYGNAWQWVADGDGRGLVLGGSFSTHLNNFFGVVMEVETVGRPPSGSRWPDVGFRVALSSKVGE